MDSFSYCLEDRGPLFLDDMDFPVNSLERSNNYVKDFALRGVHDLDKTMLILEGETVEGTGSVESVFPHMIGDFLLGNPCLGVDNSFVKATSSSLFSSNPCTQQLGFSTELSNSCYNNNDMKATLMNSENLIDSKQGSRLSPDGSNVSSLVEDSLPAKTDFHPQSLHCRVHGCYKDLSSSIDYHKRHKVCDLHSKSAKVVINGIEKRFCQQCSRFHLLKEFDDIKRSCRKRLAGHNERRRRPQFGSQLGSHSGVLEMDLMKSGSFLLIEEEHPAGFYYQEKSVDDNQRKHIKLEKFPGAGKIELPMQLDYGCAPSLLSFKSKSVSNYSSPGNSEAINPVITANYPDYKTVYKKSSQHSRPRTVSSTEFQEEPMIYDGSTDVKSYGLSQFSESTAKYQCSPEEAGSTLDLLQLSSHLQRVEQQQNFCGQIKQENLI